MDTYIINPFVIYLIEQLDTFSILLRIISGISILVVFLSLYHAVNETCKNDTMEYPDEPIEDMGILSNLSYTKEITDRIEARQKDIQETLNTIKNRDTLNYNEKEYLSNSLNADQKLLRVNLSRLDEVVKMVDKELNVVIRFRKILKISLTVFIASILLNTLLPAKDAAYKILISSYVTQENITTMGSITTDIANGIVDKLTESIIKIQEAGK